MRTRVISIPSVRARSDDWSKIAQLCLGGRSLVWYSFVVITDLTEVIVGYRGFKMEETDLMGEFESGRMYSGSRDAGTEADGLAAMSATHASHHDKYRIRRPYET